MGKERLLHRRRGLRQGAVHHRDPAAERDGLAARGPRPQPEHPGHDHPPEADAGLRGAVPAGHGPRRHRHPERGGAGAGQGGPVAARPGPRGVRGQGVGVEGRVRRPHPGPAAPPGHLRGLVPRALHHGRGPVPRGAERLQADVRRRPDLPGRAHHQLVPALSHRAVGHRGGPLRRGRRDGVHPLRQRRGLHRGGDHARRDDARRHRRGRAPRRRALPAPDRPRGGAAADRPPHPGDRRPRTWTRPSGPAR